MIKFTAFRTRKPRQFNYLPRYYDPEQEAREERRKQVLGITDADEGGEYVPGNYIRTNMRARLKGDKRVKQHKTLSLRIFILFSLAGVSLWIWLESLPILIAAILVGFLASRILTR